MSTKAPEEVPTPALGGTYVTDKDGVPRRVDPETGKRAPDPAPPEPILPPVEER